MRYYQVWIPVLALVLTFVAIGIGLSLHDDDLLQIRADPPTHSETDTSGFIDVVKTNTPQIEDLARQILDDPGLPPERRKNAQDIIESCERIRVLLDKIKEEENE